MPVVLLIISGPVCFLEISTLSRFGSSERDIAIPTGVTFRELASSILNEKSSVQKRRREEGFVYTYLSGYDTSITGDPSYFLRKF